MALVGNAPVDLGLVDVSPDEMMFWMYCPIKRPGSVSYYIPDNLKWAGEIVVEAARDFHKNVGSSHDHYVYLTAKTLWVSGDYIGNRPGWHTDGFGTDDINYIWADRAPTQFVDMEKLVEVSDDCDMSMVQMASLADSFRLDKRIRTYPDKHLLRLDPSVVHRSPVKFAPGMRSFVKVSFSKDLYDLVGNSVNHHFPDLAPKAQRRAYRNHPASRHAA